MWKLAHNQLPIKITSNFNLNVTDNNIAQRLILGNYHLPIPRLDYAKQHITFSGVQLWNSKIPKALKSIPSLKLFCKKCKTWLLDTLL